ncbi:hypothetical protein [Brachybacterium sp. AOP35-5H-19]|uniref:hypothetical protein n=1 Tax=Brachybacterium sp. AOP35-5H-19 TaxID=3457685 RepID=UPI004033CC78
MGLSKISRIRLFRSDELLVARHSPEPESQDYKWHLRQGRIHLKNKAYEEAERLLARSLEIRFTPWAATSLGKLLIETNRLDELHSLEDRAIIKLGNSWKRPDFFPARRLMDYEKLDNGENLTTPLPNDASNLAAWKRNQLLSEEIICIADRAGYRITFRRGATDSSVLLISFGAANSGLSSSGFGSDFAKIMKYDHIYVAQKPDSQYQDLSINDFYQAVAPFAKLYPNVVTYGSSLGAYCAIYYGGCVDAKILASAPRNSAHPVIAHPKYKDLIYKHADIPKVPCSSKNPVIFVDPTMAVDMNFIHTMIEPVYPQLKTVEVEYAGHAVLHAIRELGILKRFIVSIIEDDVVQDIAWGGKSNPTWLRERGRYYIDQKQWNLAEDSLLHSLQIDFSSKTSYYMANLLYRTDRHAELSVFADEVKRKFGDLKCLSAPVRKFLLEASRS